MAAVVATLAPTTAGGEDERLPSSHQHQAGAAASSVTAASSGRDEPQPEPEPEPEPQPGEGGAGPGSAPREHGPEPAAAIGRPGGQVVPVLPLGAGLTCLGLGIAIIGLRMRQGCAPVNRGR
jgi:hypothetical protein